MAQAHNNTPAMARRSRIPSIFAPTRARRVWLPVAPKKCHGAGCQRQVAASLRTLHDSTLEEFSLFLLWLLAKRAVDGIDGNRRHHAVAFAIGMPAIMRPSISPVIWPLMPRLTKSRPEKYSVNRQPSVIESPRNTTRGVFDEGGPSRALSSA